MIAEMMMNTLVVVLGEISNISAAKDTHIFRMESLECSISTMVTFDKLYLTLNAVESQCC